MVTAREINPRKQYRFAVTCEGLETAFVQKVKLPKLDMKSTPHGDGPFKINTVSRVEFGQCEMESLKPADSSSLWWKDWLGLIVNLGTGALGAPEAYKKTLIVEEYGSDGVTVVEKTTLEGCYPVEIDLSDLDKLGEGNAIDKIKLNVDRMVMEGMGESTT